LGLCPVGESGAFVEGGQRIALDGRLPINTNGGQLSGGRTHGLGYVHEACLQLWGRAEGRQTAENRVSVVAAGGGPLGGSLLLVREEAMPGRRQNRTSASSEQNSVSAPASSLIPSSSR